MLHLGSDMLHPRLICGAFEQAHTGSIPSEGLGRKRVDDADRTPHDVQIMIPVVRGLPGDELAQVFLTNFGFRVGHLEEVLVNLLKSFVRKTESQLHQSVL